MIENFNMKCIECDLLLNSNSVKYKAWYCFICDISYQLYSTHYGVFKALKPLGSISFNYEYFDDDRTYEFVLSTKEEDSHFYGCGQQNPLKLFNQIMNLKGFL